MMRLRIILTLPVLAGLAGCGGGGAVSGQQQRVIKDATPDQVLAEAAVILKREFGRVRVDPVARTIITAPVEYTTDRESGTARDLYRGRSTMRHKATFSVGRKSGAPVARLRIDVERRDTVRQQVMQPRGHRLSDAPGHETPIDRDAATTEQQNTVWTRVRRDTRLERAILEELRERFARLTAEPERARTGTEPPAKGKMP
ncbi:MAG: hypothetical protein KAY37_04400 [Phycisphaerae bacterium]|nr:hypothetical protein [Phycisphaerae bacterium]